MSSFLLEGFVRPIYPNQRRIRFWYSAGLKTPPTRVRSIFVKNFTYPNKNTLLTSQTHYVKIPKMTIEKPYPEITFERMQQKDLEQVMAIEEEAFPDPWSKSFFTQELRKRKTYIHLYIVRLNNEVIGYIVFYLFRGEGHIMNIAVTSEYRRRGVAKYLLASALEVVRKNAGEEVFLEVSVNNTAAQELYKQFGFEVYGIRKRYYSNGEDAYVLRKEVQR
ncbi:MAG: ribosomal protein S18-alanine N-acetyltransferase [Candidatus Poribacteria bacterium]|nr:ribosomal protein S18-alanine N-acetyltransferase [Candidatus Poribacteria bacterium]